MELTFYGGAKMVTGANYLLESENEGVKSKILVDCGLFQGSTFCEKMNFEPFPYNPKDIDAIFVTHAHIDHIGRLPKIYKNGFRGTIYSTPPTKDFAELLLIDSEHLLRKEAEEKNLPPLYDLNDIAGTMEIWEGVRYHHKIRIKNIEVEFYDAGHILGASFITVSAEGKKIVFSGDLGNVPAPLVKDTEYISEADYAVIESTYGNRIHEDLSKSKEIIEDLIEDTTKKKGVLMIPAFALERTQELLFELNNLIENGRIPRIPIFIDSPLAIKITSVYKKYSSNPDYFDEEALKLLRQGDAIFDFPGLKLTLTTEQSKEINNAPPPKIIIAGAGMSNGGRILYHEARYLSDPKSTILFVGFQALGSLGREILDGAKKVKISGIEIAVRCRKANISGYSAHADQPKLLDWLKPMRRNLKEVFIVQGEEDQMIPLSQKISDELALKTTIPSIAQKVML